MRKPASSNAIDYSGFAFPKGSSIRLIAQELSKLRIACLKRAKGKCQECGESVSDNFPAWHPKKYHMAHIKSRGAGGSDSLANVRTLCGECHRTEHSSAANTKRCDRSMEQKGSLTRFGGAKAGA